MKRLIVILSFIAGFSLLAAQCGGATSEPQTEPQTEPQPQIEIKDISARILPENGAIYLTIVNNGGTDDALISAKTNVAKVVELHETTMDDNDVMRMAPVEKYEIPAGGSVTLERGGKHIMLMGIQGEWQVGDEIDLTLTFQEAEPINVKAQVTEAGSSDQDGGMNHGDMGDDDMGDGDMGDGDMGDDDMGDDDMNHEDADDNN